MRSAYKYLLCLPLAISLGAGPVFADYRAATNLYAQRRYIESANAYFQASGYPKAPGEKERSEWGLAQSLTKLGFYYSASKYFSVIARRGPVAGNAYFSKALEELSRINATMNLGQAHIVQLFKVRLDPVAVPQSAAGFYFYYLGVDSFNQQKYEQAYAYFQRVPAGPYQSKARFHLGVVADLRGQYTKAREYFKQVIASAERSEDGDWIREQSFLNLARVEYEDKKYRSAIENYAQIPRDSDNWLEALFEASWTFFMLQNHNNTLGTIHTLHSPFFENRFFPESYILQAITYLRLCRYKSVKESLVNFRSRYKGVLDDLGTMRGKYKSDPKGFYNLVLQYREGRLNEYKRAWAILDAMSRTDIFKEANQTVRFADREVARLSRYSSVWGRSGLQDDILGFLRNKKQNAVNDAGRRLFDKSTEYYNYLKELSLQTVGINTEMLLGRVDALRAQLKVGTADKRANFIGGLKELNVSQDLEYWPFEGEYWEDELGGYVYNIESLCGKAEDGGAAKKGN